MCPFASALECSSWEVASPWLLSDLSTCREWARGTQGTEAHPIAGEGLIRPMGHRYAKSCLLHYMQNPLLIPSVGNSAGQHGFISPVPNHLHRLAGNFLEGVWNFCASDWLDSDGCGNQVLLLRSRISDQCLEARSCDRNRASLPESSSCIEAWKQCWLS